MVWGTASDSSDHRARGEALTAAYRGPEGMPVYDRPGMRGGSRGGAPIWVMREAWMPARSDRKCICPDPACTKHGVDRAMKGLLRLSRNTAEMNAGRQRGDLKAERMEPDPDGFAVFGRYPKGFLNHVLRTELLGTRRRDDILHVCSGTLGPYERWSVDLRHEARPLVQATGAELPFRDGSFPAVMLDPPYSDEYAKNLYGVENPRPSWLLREAARVVEPGGRIGILHVAVPFAPPGCKLRMVYGISTGVGFRIRAFTVYEREQAGVFARSPERSPE